MQKGQKKKDPRGASATPVEGFERLMEVGLKLNPSKCKFARKEVDYLGHVITREGLQVNPRLVESVKE